MLLSAATKRILLFKIRCALVQHSLSQPESFIVGPLLLILCISMYTAVKAFKLSRQLSCKAVHNKTFWLGERVLHRSKANFA